uniref:Reverse transcriptase zinc-binding domain-containing protein n=1 Tax=Romanomermis culicivorax TaxID=13658 RepID=A0A915HEF3_ROMCU
MKSTAAGYLRNLETFNKDRKPPVIWADDLTKSQREEKHKNWAIKNQETLKQDGCTIGCFNYINKYKLKESGECTHCKKEEEIIHIISECKAVEQFWCQLKK